MSSVPFRHEPSTQHDAFTDILGRELGTMMRTSQRWYCRKKAKPAASMAWCLQNSTAGSKGKHRVSKSVADLTRLVACNNFRIFGSRERYTLTEFIMRHYDSQATFHV